MTLNKVKKQGKPKPPTTKGRQWKAWAFVYENTVVDVLFGSKKPTHRDWITIPITITEDTSRGA